MDAEPFAKDQQRTVGLDRARYMNGLAGAGVQVQGGEFGHIVSTKVGIGGFRQPFAAKSRRKAAPAGVKPLSSLRLSLPLAPKPGADRREP